MSFRLCPNAPHGPRDCGMVAVQVDAAGNRWTCTTCFEKVKDGKAESPTDPEHPAPAQAARFVEATG